MHPNTKPAIVTLVLCMLILGILLLPLPYMAYKVLKFFLSLGLLYPAGFFLRPCKKLSFTPADGRVEVGTRNPPDGTFTGTLEDARTGERLAVLDKDNSQIIAFLDDAFFWPRGKSLPPISLKVSLGLLTAAVVMNPLAQVHLPKSSWMFLDVLILALLGYAWHLIKEENDGNRPYFSLTQTVGQPPVFPFTPVSDMFRHAARVWPAVLGGAFAIGLLGTMIGDGEFEDISLGRLLVMQMPVALAGACLGAYYICNFAESVANKDVDEYARRRQVPGVFFITAFLLIYLSFAFGGYFTPKPTEDPRDYPADYDSAPL